MAAPSVPRVREAGSGLLLITPKVLAEAWWEKS